MDEVNMATRDVPKAMSKSIFEYFEYTLMRNKHRSMGGDDGVLAQLPASMKMRLKVAKCRHSILSIPLFRSVSADCLIAVIDKLTRAISMPGEYICCQGLLDNQMYI